MAVDLPPGWLEEAEATELARLAKGRVVLELGAWKGRSTVVFARVAEYVISVDRHQGIPDEGYPEDSLPDYLDNVRGLPNVAIVVADFAAIVPHLAMIEMVYIDGNHDSLSVQHDTLAALALDPRLIAFHDWDIESVRMAGIAILGDPDRVVGSVASFRR